MIKLKKNEEGKTSVNANMTGGVSFVGILTVAFIVLKLVGVISWSWLWVLSPIWISAGLSILALIIVIVFMIIINKINN